MWWRRIPKQLLLLGHAVGPFYSVQDLPGQRHFCSLSILSDPTLSPCHCFINTRVDVFALWRVFLIYGNLSLCVGWPWPCPAFHLTLGAQGHVQSFDEFLWPKSAVARASSPSEFQVKYQAMIHHYSEICQFINLKQLNFLCFWTNKTRWCIYIRTIEWDIKLILAQVCFPSVWWGNAYAFVYLCKLGMLTSFGRSRSVKMCLRCQ